MAEHYVPAVGPWGARVGMVITGVPSSHRQVKFAHDSTRRTNPCVFRCPWSGYFTLGARQDGTTDYGRRDKGCTRAVGVGTRIHPRTFIEINHNRKR